MRLAQQTSPGHSHRPSFTEQLRGMPSSPRGTRQLSLSEAQMRDLMNNPPTAGSADPKFAGRDWQHIAVGELVHPEDVRWVEVDTGVEDATNLLTESGAPALLVRASKNENSAVATFDYRDLTQYLLFATGQLQPDDEHLMVFEKLAKKAQQGHKIPLRDAKSLGNKEPFLTLPHTADLTAAVETFGGGVHRIVILKEGTNHAIGILSQLRLVKFLWENGRAFPIIDELYPREVKDLGIGSQGLISVNGDKPLKEALMLMNNEGVTSLAVVDNNYNVVGNISNADVKVSKIRPKQVSPEALYSQGHQLLTKSSSAPLLENTCIHFISVILSTRGMIDGKDSYPVFHINPQSTLAHTVAKLVATQAHRMWVVETPTPSSTPSSSAPTTPGPGPTLHAIPISISHPPVTYPPHLSTSLPQANPPFQPLSATPSVSASAMPGHHMSGRLSGVISLTDILNLFARASGLHPTDPEEARRKRRGSSSSSRSGVRGSLDSARSSVVDLREKR
ncbi:MAG: cell separation during budding [Alectoria fallacina]|uniref:Cell separation during budding n=1 Tax=Alectoria fallacina TaxID=1903189 RepID=A0A8H3I9I6_9LECA|nr:MAG: cell separation during budding [Alectoria fallacina]